MAGAVRTWDYSQTRVWDHARRRRRTWLQTWQAWAAQKVARVRMAVAILRTIWHWTDAQVCDTAWILNWWPQADLVERGVVCSVSRATQHPAWTHAIAAVERTSYTLALNRRQAWVALARGLKDRHDFATSLARHLHAMKCLDEAVGGALTAHERNILVELAYLDHARRGERQRGTSARL